MIERYVIGPFAHGAPGEFARADLEFYGINHFRPSFYLRVYFNASDVTAENADDYHESYAGSFAIFGHEKCVGSEGHCDTNGEIRRFDDRPSHPLTRAFKRVIVTDALRNCLGSPQLSITLIASCSPDADEIDGPLLDFEGLQIATFV